MLSTSLWRAQPLQHGPQKSSPVQAGNDSDLDLDELADVTISQGEMAWADDPLDDPKSGLPPTFSTRSRMDLPKNTDVIDFFAPSSLPSHDASPSPLSRSSSTATANNSVDTTPTTVATTTTTATKSDHSSLAGTAKTDLTLPTPSPSPSSESSASLGDKAISPPLIKKKKSRHHSRERHRTKSAPSTPRGSKRSSGRETRNDLHPIPDVPSLPPDLANANAISKKSDLYQSFGSHSFASLRDLAAAWVPGGARHQPSAQEEIETLDSVPQSASQQQLVPVPKDDGKKLSTSPTSPRAPIRLDRRRIDKAVTLAVEAAQAAEEDERLRRNKERRKKARAAERTRRAVALERERRQQSSILGKIKTLSEYSALSDGEGGSRFGSLPWRRRGAPVSPAKELAPRSRTTPNSPHTSDEDTSLDEEDLATSMEGGESEEEEDDEEDNFSLSLYLSSLSYLLSALPGKEAGHLPEKERAGLKAKLHEVLRDIGDDDDIVSLTTQATGSSGLGVEVAREERLRELLEIELRKAEARMTGGSQGTRASKINGGTTPHDRHNAATPSIASTVALSALQLTITVAAAGVGLVGSGLSRLAPPAPHDGDQAGDGEIAQDGEAKIIGEVAEEVNAVQRRSGPSKVSGPPVEVASRQRSGGVSDRKGTGASGTGVQWDLAMALASSTASTLYGCLSSAANEAARQDAALTLARKGEVNRGGGSQCIDDEDYGMALSAVTQSDLQNMPEDQLILLSASFARALKQSPLPSQVAKVSSQLLALLHSMDQKYSLSKRATDEALKRTRQGLGYARRRGWHVKVVRAAWALVEMSVAGVEAWREEEEGEDKEKEKEEQQQQQRRSQPQAQHTPRVVEAAQVQRGQLQGAKVPLDGRKR